MNRILRKFFRSRELEEMLHNNLKIKRRFVKLMGQVGGAENDGIVQL